MLKKILKKLLKSTVPSKTEASTSERTNRAEDKLDSVSTVLEYSTNTVAIDLGANVGFATQEMVDLGATVYAFEPNPYAYQKLSDRFADSEKVTCYSKAVLDKETTVDLYLHEQSDDDEVKWSVGSSLLGFKGNVNRDKKHTVKTVDLSAFIFSLGVQIDLIKMDVEGVECRIINHLIDTGAIHKVKYMLVETHDHKIPELKAETEALRNRIKKENLSDKINLNWI